MDLAANQERFAPVDAVVKNAILQGHTPGAVVIVGHDGKVVYRKAFGSRSLDPTIEPMTVDTVFDMASLTKVMATTSSVMRLVQLGQIKLNDPVAKYIPEFAQNGKEDITIRQLLTHYSGLRADLDLKPDWTGQAEAFRLANAEKLVTPPGSTFLYSDINFIVLGELVQTGQWTGAQPVCRGLCLQSAGNDHHAISAAAVVVPAHCADAERRTDRRDAARRGARSDGAADGRSGRACGAVLHRRRHGKVRAGAAEWRRRRCGRA